MSHKWSLPSWERGLKQMQLDPLMLAQLKVAPLVGAWIETHFGVEVKFEQLSRSPRGSVD